MTQTTINFDGPLLTPSDHARLGAQFRAVFALMSDGAWRTLREISEATGASEAGASARLRDCRKAKFGGHTVERECVGGGLWRYRLITNG